MPDRMTTVEYALYKMGLPIEYAGWVILVIVLLWLFFVVFIAIRAAKGLKT